MGYYQKSFIYLYWPSKETVLCHLIMVDVTFTLIRKVDIHVQAKLFNHEWIFCQALDGIDCILSTISKAQK